MDLKSNCSNGWKYVKETKSCYFIADENMRNIWTDSQNFCRMHNADLIVINSIMELVSLVVLFY